MRPAITYENGPAPEGPQPKSYFARHPAGASDGPPPIHIAGRTL